MQWAEYQSKHQALKLHLNFELNRMIATEFCVSSGNGSERKALLQMAQKDVTYIADRGYMSFDVCHQLVDLDAHFIFRVKANLKYTVTEQLQADLPINAQALFKNIKDELITYDNDENKNTYRLISFAVGNETFLILTNRQDLTTYQVITLYAYRWQIELLFRFLKRTMKGIHLVKHDSKGVTIQFYAMLIMALLQLRLKQHSIDIHEGAISSQTEPVSNQATEENESEKNLSKQGFFETIGKNLHKYWKIGSHWLAAFKLLLDKPFDNHAVAILCST
jgi:transposase